MPMTIEQLRAVLAYIDQRILDLTEGGFTQYESSGRCDSLRFELAEAFGVDPDIL